MTSHLSSRRPDFAFTVIVGWLEGGGAQAALHSLLASMPPQNSRLIILFRGSINHDSLMSQFSHVVQLQQPRSVGGVITAARELSGLLRGTEPLYSLMRSSHVVLGLVPRKLLRARLAMTFHSSHASDQVGLRGKVEGLLVRRAARVAVLITSPSPLGLRELREAKLGGRNTRCIHEPNIVKRSGTAIEPARSGRLDRVRLLYAGRLEREKGADTLVDLVNSCRVPVDLIVAGSGSLRPVLDDARSFLEGTHTIELVGHVPDIARLIDASDAVMVPSREELLGMTILEAFTRGRPCIVRRLFTLQHLAEDPRVLMFEDRDEFADCVSQLSINEAVRVNTFAETRTRVAEPSSRTELQIHLQRGQS